MPMPDCPTSEHRPIPGYPGYCAHPNGTIFSCHNNRWGYGPWRALRPGTNNKYGRLLVVLRDATGRHRSHHVHRLILTTFRGPCPPGMEACHNNGKPYDNRLSNLRWDTRANNGMDTRRHGSKKGERHHRATLTNDIVRGIRRRAAQGETHQAIATAYGMSRRNVSRIVQRERWSHI